MWRNKMDLVRGRVRQRQKERVWVSERETERNEWKTRWAALIIDHFSSCHNLDLCIPDSTFTYAVARHTFFSHRKICKSIHGNVPCLSLGSAGKSVNRNALWPSKLILQLFIMLRLQLKITIKMLLNAVCEVSLDLKLKPLCMCWYIRFKEFNWQLNIIKYFHMSGISFAWAGKNTHSV